MNANIPATAVHEWPLYSHDVQGLHGDCCIEESNMLLRNVGMIVFYVASILHGENDAKSIRGQLITRQNWAFIARFCFLSEEGKFNYHFVINGVKAKVNLLLYYDTPSQWASIYPTNKTCQEKVSVLSIRNKQIVPLTMREKSANCTKTDTEVRCRSWREFRSQRPRWWFIALSDCASETGLNVTYAVDLTNGPPGSFWKEHFSADEFYILPELIATACVYVIFVGLSIYTAIQLKARRLLHITYKLFMLSLTSQLWGVLFEMYAYIILAVRGIEVKGILLIGHLLEALSETIFTLLLLLLALGYTVTKSVLNFRQIRMLGSFIGVTILLHLLLFIYASEVFDPGVVLYIYESPPGYALLILKLIAWLIFVSCCFRTTKKAATKFHFYTSLLSLGSGWFICQPLMVLAITLLVDEWIRESVVKGGSLWIVLIGHVTFLIVTRPGASNVHFPFHIRTFQVVPIGGEGQSHSYEPQGRNGGPLFTLTHI